MWATRRSCAMEASTDDGADAGAGVAPVGATVTPFSAMVTVGVDGTSAA